MCATLSMFQALHERDDRPSLQSNERIASALGQLLTIGTVYERLEDVADLLEARTVRLAPRHGYKSFRCACVNAVADGRSARAHGRICRTYLHISSLLPLMGVGPPKRMVVTRPVTSYTASASPCKMAGMASRALDDLSDHKL